MSKVAIHHLATNPAAYARFRMTGQLPRTTRPDSPLIRLLESIPPRHRMLLKGLTVNPSLGYNGSRQFHNAEQALRWCKPANEVLESRSFPAESWRLKNFHQQLAIEDLLKNCSSPDEAEKCLRQSVPRLFSTRPTTGPGTTPEDSLETLPSDEHHAPPSP